MSMVQINGPTVKDSTCECGELRVFSSSYTCPNCTRWGTPKTCETCVVDFFRNRRSYPLMRIGCAIHISLSRKDPDRVCEYWENGVIDQSTVCRIKEDNNE